MKTIAEEIQDLRQLQTGELVARYEKVFEKPPRVRHPDWLWKRIAWKIQEQRYGGLSETAKHRLETLIAEIDLPPTERARTLSGKLKNPKKRANLVAGTVLVRTWKGREIRVHVLESGFEWDAVVYGSLSAVAKAVTGSRWSGPLFFRLRKRTKK